MGNKTKHAPFTRKDNFWSKKRVEANVTLKEIGAFLGKGDTLVGTYFSGQNMPDDNTIRALCDFFDVDFNDGQLEFQHAHRSWKAEHHAPLKYTSKGATSKEKSENFVTENATTVSAIDNVLTSLYGVLSCTDFINVYNSLVNNKTIDNLAELIYGKFDYVTYNKILETVSGNVKVSDEKSSI